jgi:hypothetical protein
MPRERRPLKYDPLAAYLAHVSPEVATVALTVAEIEAIVGESLPAGAATAAWWVNTRSSSQGRAWLGAGWRAGQVRLRQTPAVATFVRTDWT